MIIKDFNNMTICELVQLWEMLGFEFEINDGRIVGV